MFQSNILYAINLHSYMSNIFNKNTILKKAKAIENMKQSFHFIRWKFYHNKINSYKKLVSLEF